MNGRQGLNLYKTEEEKRAKEWMNWQVRGKKELKEKYGVEKGDIEKRRSN